MTDEIIRMTITVKVMVSLWFLDRHAVRSGTDQSDSSQKRLAVNAEVDSQMLSLVAGHYITSDLGPNL